MQNYKHENSVTYCRNNRFKRKNARKKGEEKNQYLSKCFLPICIKLNLIMVYILTLSGILTIIL